MFSVPLLVFCLFVRSVMNLDRVENRTHVRRRFPRYHTSLFRGQAPWDPYTHVILPPAALVSRQQQQQHSWKEKERLEKERKAANLFRKKFEIKKKTRLFQRGIPAFPATSPQNPSPAPVGISANHTGGYTAARRAVLMPEQPITIVIMLIYRSLGAALPPKYHADRRGVRLGMNHCPSTSIDHLRSSVGY